MPRLVGVATLLAAVMVAVVLTVGAAGRRTADAAADATVAARAGGATAALRSDIVDLETGLRGFGLTGNDSLLRPFEEARERLAADGDALEAALIEAGIDLPTGQLRVALDDYVDQYAPRVLAAGRPTPTALVAEGRERVDVIRAAIGALSTRIEALRADRRARVRESSDRIDRVVPGAIGIALAVILATVLAAWLWVVRPLRDLAAMTSPSIGGRGGRRARGLGEVAGVQLAMGAMAARLEREERRAAARTAVMAPFGARLAGAATVDDVREVLLAEAQTAFGGHDAELATRTLDGRYAAVTTIGGARRWGGPDDLVVRALDAPGVIVDLAAHDGGATIAFPLRDATARFAISVGLPAGTAPDEIDPVLVEQVGSVAAEALARAEVADREHEISTVLQRALLPDRFPEVEGLQIASRFRPQAADGLVGGDVLDVQALSDGRIGLFVGDVSGKGPQAAGYAAVARSEVRAASTRERDPAIALALADAILTASDHRDGRHVTAALILAERVAGGVEMALATAGHPPALVLNAGVWDVLRSEPAPPLGTSLGTGTSARRVLGPGDAVILFTDGLTEARAPERIDHPEDLLRLLDGIVDIEEALDRLMVHAAPGDAAPRDDVALLGLAVPAAV